MPKARSFIELFSAAHKAKWDALKAGQKYKGHFLVTMDEFAEIAINTHQFDPDNIRLAELDVGVVPNDWNVGAA